MLTLYRSNRAEVLAQLLAAQLRHPPPGPLEPVQVVVNTWPTSRWLGEALALHLGGVAAHLRFPFPGSHLRRMVQLILADGEGSEQEAEADPWRAIHLVWSVLEELPRIAAEPGGELLQLWLEERSGPGTVDLPLWQLARAVADAFDDYALYRPDLLEQWDSGRDLTLAGQPLPSQQLWQPRLYRRLRQRLGAEPFGLRVKEVIRRLRSGHDSSSLLREHLGERLRLFGPSSMAPIQVQLLQALATWIPVDLYLLTPCPGLWQRCTARRQALSEALALHQPLEGEWMGQAPPLEARFGRMGAEFQQLLEGTGETQLSEEREEALFVLPSSTVAGRAPRLLQQLQEQLLRESLPCRFSWQEGDHSLEFHACPGPLRQVQIVRDRLLQLLAADPSLEPRHILVMTPAVETFAPLVATVFGDREATGVDLPWRLTDRSQHREAGVGRCLLDLLSLAGDRLTASGLEQLLECAPLQARFGLTAEEAEEVTRRLQDCGFRWGLGAADRRGDPTHSLGWAMDRLLLGLVLPEPDGTWETDTAPAVFPQPLEESGRTLHLLLRLRHWLAVLAEPRSSSTWVELLVQVLADLFDPASAETEISSVHQALEDWRLSAGDSDLPVEPAVVGAVLQERLGMDSGRFGHRSGALTISALEPMRAIPHRVLVLMGLDGGVFPRQAQRPGFHLMEGNRMLGDPDPADQDRYALLEALLSARDALLITWNCREERTGVTRPPAAPVQQWLQWLASCLPQEAAGRLVVSHEPNPFAPENFEPRGAFPPASCDRRLLATCLHLESGIAAVPQGLAREATLPREEVPGKPGEAAGTTPRFEDDPAGLEELRHWLLTPQRHWLRGLGMVPRERRADVADLEDLELAEKDRFGILEAALQEESGQQMAPATPEAWLNHHRGEGRFPPAQGAVLEACRLQQRWHSLQDALESLGKERPFDAPWGSWAKGTRLRGNALVLVQPGQIRTAQRLDLWLRLLLAVVNAPPGAQPERGVLITRGKDDQRDTLLIRLVLQAPDRTGASRELERLQALWRTWQTHCWPVPPETGYGWIQENCPEPGTAAFEKVEAIWEGSNRQEGGEGGKEEMEVCFGSRRSLSSLLQDLPFGPCARELFGPIHGAVISGGPRSRSGAGRS